MRRRSMQREQATTCSWRWSCSAILRPKPSAAPRQENCWIGPAAIGAGKTCLAVPNSPWLPKCRIPEAGAILACLTGTIGEMFRTKRLRYLMNDIRIIKKYPNRRLYDTKISLYITLEEVSQLVIGGVKFRVEDTRTREA